MGAASSPPPISVLLPVYNAELYLEACLESLARQTQPDFEIVAVDDGSSDRSAAILQRAARRDPRLRTLRTPHRGLVEALNQGLDACRGALVARLDADDLAHPQRLELQAAALNRADGPDVVSSLVAHFPRQELGEGFRVYEHWLNSLIEHEEIVRERFIESPLPHPSVMLRRRDLIGIGGYLERGWPEDYDLWLRLAAAGKRFAKVPQVLCLWRHHEGRLTRNDSRYSVERFLACKAHHLLAGPLRGCQRLIIWGAGQTGRRLSKHLLRGGAPLAAFIDIDRRKIGRTLRGVPVHASEELPRLSRDVGQTVVLVAVSSRGARALIRRRLDALGFEETGDYWCVA